MLSPVIKFLAECLEDFITSTLCCETEFVCCVHEKTLKRLKKKDMKWIRKARISDEFLSFHRYEFQDFQLAPDRKLVSAWGEMSVQTYQDIGEDEIEIVAMSGKGVSKRTYKIPKELMESETQRSEEKGA